MFWYGKRWKKGCLVFLAAAALLAAGCSIETTNGAKVADLDYEIVEEAQIPEKAVSYTHLALPTILRV